MDNKATLIFIRYFSILVIIVSMFLGKTDISSDMLIAGLAYIINNQLRYFSLENRYARSISFVIEIAFILISYRAIGGPLFPYLLIAAIDSNMIFVKPLNMIFNGILIIISIYFSMGNTLEFITVNIGVTIMGIAIFYYSQGESNRKLKAQELYDELKLSEDKLKKLNRDLELYASSIEELTLLRERNRISRDIHDSVGHALSTIAIQLGAIEKTISRDEAMAVELTKNLRTFTQDSLSDVRMSVRKMKPKEFEDSEGVLVIEGLVENFKKLSGVDVRLSFTKDRWSLNSEQTYILYRIIQEFLSNSVRHGKASSIRILMAFTEYKLVVTLKDNGVGADKIEEGIGFKSIKERIAEIGGRFDYSTSKGEGFLVKLEINKAERLKVYSKGDKYGED